MKPPAINPAQAVDLAQVTKERESARAAQEAQQQAALEAAVEQFKRWDRAMSRTFKGIVSRRTRHILLEESARRAQRDANA